MQQSWLLPSPALNPTRLLSSPVLLLPVPTRPQRPPLPSALCTTTTGTQGGGGELTARERRQLRNERRESRMGTNNWKEDVEEKLLVKPKKRYASWTEELNLDNLALLGPQWWVIRVSRVTGQETADRLVRAFIRVYPAMDFKVYIPAVRVKKKLKNGSYSVKPKPLFPGCVFLHCVLNKEIHDFVRECHGIGGFLGSRVGNTKRQINRPKPVAEDEMEAIFRQAKEEQENIDRAFEEEQKANGCCDVDLNDESSTNKKSTVGTKQRRTKKISEPSESDPSSKGDHGQLAPGSSVRFLSGPFTGYTGRLKELNRKTGKATVGFMLFGKESFVDLQVDQIVAGETT